MGLPELSLGILPGFGGTQRLPRLVGLQQAIQMMLTSKPIKDKAALQLGLVDGVIPAEKLLAAARSLALEIADGCKPRNLSLFRSALLPLTDLASCPTICLKLTEIAQARVISNCQILWNISARRLA